MARQTIQNANASLYLDGNAGYLTVPITPGLTGFSFGLWIKPGKRTTASSSIYMSSNSGSFTNGFILSRGVGRGDIDFLAYNSTNSGGTLTTGQVSDGTWHHIAVTYLPSGSCSIYQNGALVQTITASNSMATGTTSIYVGRRSYTAAFAGLNASNLVWHNTTTPWTAAQVLALYQSGTIPTGATAVYPLSEGAGTVAYDTSGNGNDGTITSGTWSRDTPTKTRNKLDGIPYFNGDFETVPTFVAATTTGDGCVDGTAAGTTYSSPNKYGWQISSWAGTYSAQFDTSERYSGTASMKLTLGATGSRIKVRRYSGTVAYSLNQERIPCNPSTEYTVKYWMKTSLSGSATSGANVTLAQYRQNGITGAGASAAGTVVKTTTDWTQYTVTLTTNATARFIQPELNLVGDDGAATLIGSAWYDDIQLYPTTPITRSAATGRLTATGRSAA